MPIEEARARFGIDAAHAFAMLTKLSQDSNTPLPTVATIATSALTDADSNLVDTVVSLGPHHEHAGRRSAPPTVLHESTSREIR